MPLRLRLTLTFAGVMAVVVGGFGAFLYLRLEARLDQALDRELGGVLAELTGVARDEAADLGKPGEEELAERGERYTQFLTPSGRRLDASPQARPLELVDAGRRARALGGEEIVFDRPAGTGVADRLRVGARRVAAGERTLVAAAGVSLAERDAGLRALATLLLIGGPVAVLLASAAGYALASAALRPVEAMRRRAAAVSPDEPGTRLPVPDARDEVRRLAETLNEMLDRQEAAFERERAFVSDASHELRTPLAVLKAELELALRRSRTTEELLSALRSAAEETDRLAQLAEDLLVIARFQEGRLPIRAEPIAVGAAFETASRRFRRRFEESGRELSITDGVDGLRVSADRLRLEQALGNLLENALRHGAGRVRLWPEVDGDHVALHVVDEGPGFPDGLRTAAFERFTRADTSRTSRGAGLGLAIVDAIARAHGGTAEAGEAPGGGADVRISLPLDQASDSSATASSSREGREPGSGSRQASTAAPSSPGTRR